MGSLTSSTYFVLLSTFLSSIAFVKKSTILGWSRRKKCKHFSSTVNDERLSTKFINYCFLSPNLVQSILLVLLSLRQLHYLSTHLRLHRDLSEEIFSHFDHDCGFFDSRNTIFGCDMKRSPSSWFDGFINICIIFNQHVHNILKTWNVKCSRSM